MSDLPDPPPEVSAEETTRQIRGSAVLLGGRVLSLLIGMATQVLLVRGLSRSSYGAFAFALALATSARTLVSFGEDQAFTRFLTLYSEERDHPRLFGTYVMVITKVLVTSGALIVTLLLARDALAGTLIDEPESVDLLVILILLAPIDALDRILEGSFAVFSRPRAIFVRKYLMEPGLRFAAVLLLVGLDRGPRFVAIGYVVAAAVGMLVYMASLPGVLRERGLLEMFDRRRLDYPFRAYFGFSLPLLTTELVNLSLNSVTILLLGRYAGASDVAGFRAIFPAARLNQIVIFTFTVLFTPLAARLFAREDRVGMGDAYWHTSAWLAVFTFPVAVLTIGASDAVATTLFGSEYADAGLYLALLSGGYYVNAALGFNALTLQTWGQVRWVMSVNVVATGTNILLGFLLIDQHGATGAAVAIAVALVVQNFLNQLGLRRLAIPMLDRRYLGLYASLVATGAAITLVQRLVEPPLAVTVAGVGAASALLVRLSRDRLDVEGTFPEIASLPLIGRLVS